MAVYVLTVTNPRQGMPRAILSDAQRQAVIGAYVAGERYREIAARFGISDSAVWAIIRREKIARTRIIVTDAEWVHARSFCAEQRQHRSGSTISDPKQFYRRHSVNDHALDIITPEAAYWIGLLMADGSIISGQIVLQLSGDDAPHVDRFREFLKSSHKITTIAAGRTSQGVRRAPVRRIAVSSSRLIAVLASFGVVPNKSLTAREIGGLSEHPDFWRGVVDGDGSVTTKNTFSIAGAHSLITQFCSFARRISPHCRCEAKTHFGIFSASLHGKHAALVLSAMYDTNGPALRRKSERAMTIVHKLSS